ncbi:ATP-binding protein [Methanoregula sp.]|uniref:ATP-binding protein n=1 Tax=Methanoregula sp. TaxID=2052170 RepID=UPI00236FC353|nr:ATP-binding protein [Methanoregula sp.]MDD1687263.1 PAS domain S-box protein [Methanoregula sp.]
MSTYAKMQNWLPRTGSTVWLLAFIISITFAILATVFSLTHDISEVYPFLFFLPIILVVYRYPSRGVLFTIILSTVYILLVYLLSGFNPSLVAVSTAWFVIFITMGVVTSSLAEGLLAEERKYRGIFENSQAGIFTFDLASFRIRELNGKCARMLRYDRRDLEGMSLSALFAEPAEYSAFIRQCINRPPSGDIELHFTTRDRDVRQFLISVSRSPQEIAICSIMDITERKLAERVIHRARDELELRVKERTGELTRSNEILLAEIEDRKRFADAIQLANKKLNILSSITRHDILNQITAIVMYLSLAEEEITDPRVLDRLKKIDQIVQLIQKQIRFTHNYQYIGTRAPQWQNVAVTVDEAVEEIDLGTVRVEKELGNLELYADFLLEKVFYNLVENSLRHGGHVTICRFSFRLEDNGHLIVVYEDDGVGIPADAKEKIFRREYYRNTGYGMFLTTEILGTTAMSIRETGEPGKGARFEIHVPEGSFRFGGAD